MYMYVKIALNGQLCNRESSMNWLRGDNGPEAPALDQISPSVALCNSKVTDVFTHVW